MTSNITLTEHTLAELTLDLAGLGYTATNGHVWFAEAVDTTGELAARVVVDAAGGVQVLRFSGDTAVVWSASLSDNAPVTAILAVAAAALDN